MDELLIRLTQAFDVSEVEQEIKSELQRLNCVIEMDQLGNIITKLGVGEEKYLISTEMDTISFQVY